jgi:hypothetical protein
MGFQQRLGLACVDSTFTQNMVFFPFKILKSFFLNL